MCKNKKTPLSWVGKFKFNITFDRLWTKQLRIEGHFGFLTFWMKFCNILNYWTNLKFETIVQFFRKIIQLNVVIMLKSSNEYYRKNFLKHSVKMALYPAMILYILYWNASITNLWCNLIDFKIYFRILKFKRSVILAFIFFCSLWLGLFYRYGWGLHTLPSEYIHRQDGGHFL